MRQNRQIREKIILQGPISHLSGTGYELDRIVLWAGEGVKHMHKARVPMHEALPSCPKTQHSTQAVPIHWYTNTEIARLAPLSFLQHYGSKRTMSAKTWTAFSLLRQKHLTRGFLAHLKNKQNLRGTWMWIRHRFLVYTSNWAGPASRLQGNRTRLSMRIRHNPFITGHNQALGHSSGLKNAIWAGLHRSDE